MIVLPKLLWRMNSPWPLSPKWLQILRPCFSPRFSSQNIANISTQRHAWVWAVSFQFRMWMRMSERMRAGGLNGQSMLSVVTKVWAKMFIAHWKKMTVDVTVCFYPKSQWDLTTIIKKRIGKWCPCKYGHNHTIKSLSIWERSWSSSVLPVIRLCVLVCWLSVFKLIFGSVCLSPAVKWQVSWQYVCAVPSNEKSHTVKELTWRACLERGVALLNDVTWVRRALAQRGTHTHLLTTTVWVDTVHETIWNTHTHFTCGDM